MYLSITYCCYGIQSRKPIYLFENLILINASSCKNIQGIFIIFGIICILPWVTVRCLVYFDKSLHITPFSWWTLITIPFISHSIIHRECTSRARLWIHSTVQAIVASWTDVITCECHVVGIINLRMKSQERKWLGHKEFIENVPAGHGSRYRVPLQQ